MLKAGIFGTSTKKNEKRIPLHPRMLMDIGDDIKPYLYFETGYAKDYGLTDEFLKINFGGVFERSKLFEFTDLWVLPKPTKDDFEFFRKGKILWGWPHCVQGFEITQALIENEMTVIAWEAMYGGKDNIHAFQKNNEIAGYAAVQHAMMLLGKNGYFGGSLNAAVLGYGSTGKGAVHALQGLGINNIDVFSKRPPHLIAGSPMGVNIGKLVIENEVPVLSIDQVTDKASKVLGNYNIIVNCVLQDPVAPLIFVNENDLEDLTAVTDIIDISCDRGMGFFFAKPTTLSEPIFKVPTTNINYYSVDHTPTIYWDASSYQISKVVLFYIYDLIKDKWMDNKVLLNAAEIISGRIVNKKIIEFQGRSVSFPYTIKNKNYKN